MSALQGAFDFADGPVRIVDPDSIQARCERFHRDNPRVYEMFKRFAFEVIQAGYSHYSADAIFHRIRWHVNIETRSADDFKLNDHFTAPYSRMFMEDHPAHEGFFRTRRSQTDKE